MTVLETTDFSKPLTRLSSLAVIIIQVVIGSSQTNPFNRMHLAGRLL
jgi:hypothetical protein